MIRFDGAKQGDSVGGGVYVCRTRMCGQPLHGLTRLTLIQHSLKRKTFEVKVHLQIKEISLRYGVLE